VSFVLIGNPNRPNGGILQRFEGLTVPFAGITFDGATPTNTDFKTVDITRQYDGWSDFPNNPLNPFATANAVAGIHYLHGDYQSVGLGDGLYQGAYGDTDYYMIPSQRLPLLMPLTEAGVPSPIVTILDAPTNFIIAIPTGLDDGAQEAANIRPFGTPPIDQRSPYGVGGPPVNAGSFDTNGNPLPTAPQPAAAAPDTQALAAPKQGPALPTAPQPAAASPGPLQPLPSAAPVAPKAPTPPITAPPAPMDNSPATPGAGLTPGWWKPFPPAKPDPVDATKPAPLDLPKPAPADVPKPLPVDLPKPVELPKPVDLPRTDILPKIVPPKVDPPAQAPIVNLPKPADIPVPAFVPPELPAAPVAPPVQAPVLPELPVLPAAPPPQLPVFAPPPMPALPPPPPLPDIAGILGGIRLPF
jgi:hypothetical protein